MSTQAARSFLNEVTSDRREARTAHRSAGRSQLRSGKRPESISKTPYQAKKPSTQSQQTLRSIAPGQAVLPPHLRYAAHNKQEAKSAKADIFDDNRNHESVSAFPSSKESAKLGQKYCAAEKTDSTPMVVVPSTGQQECVQPENQEEKAIANQEPDEDGAGASAVSSKDTTDSSKARRHDNVSEEPARSTTAPGSGPATTDTGSPTIDAHAVLTLSNTQQPISNKAPSRNRDNACGNISGPLPSGNPDKTTRKFSWIIPKVVPNEPSSGAPGRWRDLQAASPTPLPSFVPHLPTAHGTMHLQDDASWNPVHSSYMSAPNGLHGYATASDSFSGAPMSSFPIQSAPGTPQIHPGHVFANPSLGYPSFSHPVGEWKCAIDTGGFDLSHQAYATPPRSNSVNIPPAWNVPVARRLSKAIPIIQPPSSRSNPPAAMQADKQNGPVTGTLPPKDDLLIDFSEENDASPSLTGATHLIPLTEKDANISTHTKAELGELDNDLRYLSDRPVRVDTRAEPLTGSDAIVEAKPGVNIEPPVLSAEPDLTTIITTDPSPRRDNTFYHNTWNESSSDASSSSSGDKRYREIAVEPLPSQDQPRPIASLVESPTKALSLRARRIAREHLESAYKAREVVRKQLNSGTWEIEILAEFGRRTDDYNGKRATLAALMASRELNEEDAKLYPKLSKLDVQPPRRGLKNKKV